MKFTYRLLLLFFCWTSCLQAQNMKFTRIGVPEGLSQNSVYGIFQDSKGFMWFGTADGLNRYDGHEVKVYRNKYTEKLRGNGNFFGQNICEDKEGNIWFSSRDGLLKYDYKKDALYPFFPQNDTLRFSCLSEILGITAGADIWFWSRNDTFFCYNLISKNLRAVKVLDKTAQGKNVYRYAEMDNEGRIWYSLDKGVGTYDIRTGEFKTCLEEYFSVNHTPYLGDFLFEANGDVWIAAFNSVIRFSPRSGRYVVIVKDQPYELFSSVVKDLQGYIWIGGNRNGLVRYNELTGEKKIFAYDKDNIQSLSSNLITRLFISQSQNLWVGTDGGGISKADLKPPKFNIYRTDFSSGWNFGSNFIKCIYTDSSGKIWFGTYDGGLTIFDRKSNRVKTIRNPRSADNTISCISETPNGQIIVGGSAGVAYVNRENYAFRYIPFDWDTLTNHALSLITGLLFTKEGKLLMITHAGLFEGEERAGKIIKLRRSPLLSNYNMSTVYQTNDKRIWIGMLGSTHNYVLQYHNGKLEILDSLFKDFNIRCFYEDTCSNMLWMASEKGLIRYVLRNGSYRLYTHENGLANDYLYAIIPDRNGILWLSSNKGISSFDPARNRFTNYDQSDGLQSDEFNTGAYHRSRNGELFFGGVNGFNSFYPESIRSNPYKPQLALTGLHVLDEEVPGIGNCVTTETITLSYDQNTISFDFSGLEFTNPAKNRYRYRLSGADENWVNSGNKHYARYSSLKPGNYILKVQASNDDGVWSNEKDLIRVKILNPWWQTWWFILCACILLVMTITGIVRVIVERKLREQQRIIEKQRAIEAERTRISKDMHDDIGSGLSKIAIMSELLKNRFVREQEENDLNRSVEKISSTASDLVDSMSQIVWAMNPQNDNLENLVSYLRQFAFDFFDDFNIYCKVDFPDEIKPVKLSQEARRNIFLVVKETLNNILKHAGASTVTLSFCNDDNHFRLTVTDDGKGFDTGNTHRFGNGLINMKKRIADIGGQYSILSKPGTGSKTEILIRI
jgi:signal transduction histidine kinase/ligand-binding sensor domain-containing protein